MVIIKKGHEQSEVTYDIDGMTFHTRLADADQATLKKLFELGVEAVVDEPRKPKE